MLTRILDIVISLVGIILLLIMLPVIGLLIKLDSKGPIFYKGWRVGRNGRLFQMYKFRTMYETPQPLGASVSPAGDPRVTTAGYMLRRLKLNEFPQFFNVLKGDMTLIGPRPETPDLAAAYPQWAAEIFTVKPGLAGPNQIWGRNEEDFYPAGVDPKEYYLEHLLPPKLTVDLEYVRNKSFWLDIRYLLLTVWVTIVGAIERRHLTDNFSQLVMLVTDMVFCLLSFTLAHLIRFGGFGPPKTYSLFLLILPLTILIRLPGFIYFGFYHTLIRYFSIYDTKQIFKGVSLTSLLMIVAYFFLFSSRNYSRTVFLIDLFMLSIFLVGYREILRAWRSRTLAGQAETPKKQVLIWGAGDLGLLCLGYLSLSQDPRDEVVGFIDENPRMHRRRINGRKVLGNHHQVEILARLYKIQEIFVAQSTCSSGAVHDLERLCELLSVRLNHFFSDKGTLSSLHAPMTEERAASSFAEAG